MTLNQPMDQELMERAADQAIASGEPQLIDQDGTLLVLVTETWLTERGHGQTVTTGPVMVSADGVKLYGFRMPKGNYGVGKVLGLGKDEQWRETMPLWVRVDGQIMWRPPS